MAEAADSPVAGRADFGAIRYAQLWEDADVLVSALDSRPGQTFLSVCSAGDNALALLTLDPAEVVAADLSPAQLACLKLRLAAIPALDHAGFLELMGARESTRRDALLDAALTRADRDTQAFWACRRDSVRAFGAGGVGKFERYFRIFRRFLAPLAHSRATREAIFEPRDARARAAFFARRVDTRLWRALVRVFFSRQVMGLLGRDPAFFTHVDGSVSDHVLRRMHHAGVTTDPSTNPYLHWIFHGRHGTALPLPWRAEHWTTIRDRLERVRLHHGAIERAPVTGVDGFNLSDIFEYMSAPEAEEAYAAMLRRARPGARLVYWNMMAPRRRPDSLAHRVCRQADLEDRLKARDKAFFYRDLVIEQVREP